MNSAATTNFLNTKGRRIYQGKVGGYFIMKDGKKVYKPTAAFRQVGANGTKSKVTSTSANVPGAIRRKVRSNAGVKRGPRAVMKTPNAGNLTRMLFKSPVKRKVRSNAGVKRGPRAVMKKALGPRAAMKKGLSPMSGNLTRLLFKSPVKRKVRSNAGVKRGPRKVRQPMLNLIVISPGGRVATKRSLPKKL